MRIALRLSAALLIGTIGSFHGVVRAQVSATVQAPAAGQDQQAPGWIFTPSIRFGGSWDDNILLVNPGDNPPTDYATPLGPALDLNYRGRRTRFSTGYEGSFLMYRTFDELNSAEQHLRARLEHRATRRVTIFLDEDFARVPTTDALELAGVPFYRVGSRMNAVGGGFEAALTRRTSLRGKYSLNQVTFNDDPLIPGGALQGGHAHEVAVGLDRALSPRLTIGTTYEGRRAILSQDLDRFDTHTAAFTMQYDVTPTLAVSGLAGVSTLRAGLGDESRTGPAVRGAIIQRARYVVLSAVYSRSFIPSFGFGGTFQNEEWQGNVHVPFSRNRGYIDGSIARFDNEPLESDMPSLRSVWISGTLGYRTTRWLSVEGFYAQSRQSNRQPGGDLGRRQIGFRIVAAKPLKLR